jgi:translation initiation factor 4E
MVDVAPAINTQQPVPLDSIPISPSDATKESTGDSTGDATTANSQTQNEIRTVFDDPNNFNVKHPLMNTWTLWFTKPPSGKVCALCVRLLHGLADSYRAITGTSF